VSAVAYEPRGATRPPAERPRDGVLLTGATGFVGMELLARYLQLTDRTVYALVRADSDEHALKRVRETLEVTLGSAQPYLGRVRALAGDITHAGLGLDPEVALEVAGEISEIVHGAASVSFDLALEPSRAINVEGTRRMLQFAELCRLQGGLRRFTYISTAYVAGAHRGRFAEHELDVGQRFRNPYERTKFEAEQLVATFADRLAVTVVRPSIIVGDSATGWTASFNVLYWPLRALANGSYPVIPARGRAHVDVVSVDYVADAILALAGMPEAEGRTFHLTASGDAVTIRELLDMSVEHLRCKKPPLISPRLFRWVLRPLLCRLQPRRKRFFRATASYLPYFAVATTYDNAGARAALAPAIEPAPLGDYFAPLIAFAQRANWGTRKISRAQAARDAPQRAKAPPARCATACSPPLEGEANAAPCGRLRACPRT
jgi:thioester reductase-like protein